MSAAVPTPIPEKRGAVVIGGSAGAVQGLSRILPALPKSYPLAIMIVVHLPPRMESGLAALLAAKCQIRVKEAEDKEDAAPGCAYVAPPNYHLLVEPDGSLSLSSDEPVLYSRPSIDVLFESAADAYGNEVTGVLLSGANTDGARGMKAIGNAGGCVLVQSPAEAEATAMPLGAIEAFPSARVLTAEAIAEFLTSDLIGQRR